MDEADYGVMYERLQINPYRDARELTRQALEFWHLCHQQAPSSELGVIGGRWSRFSAFVQDRQRNIPLQAPVQVTCEPQVATSLADMIPLHRDWVESLRFPTRLPVGVSHAASQTARNPEELKYVQCCVWSSTFQGSHMLLYQSGVSNLTAFVLCIPQETAGGYAALLKWVKLVYMEFLHLAYNEGHILLQRVGRPVYGDVFAVRRLEPEAFEMDRSKHLGDMEEDEEEEEEEEEEELGQEELEAGIISVDSILTTPTGVERPDVIDVCKSQRKEPEKPDVIDLRKSQPDVIDQVLEENQELIGAGMLLGTSHTYVLNPPGDKAAPKKIDLLKNLKSDKVDVTLRPDELEVLDDNALAANTLAAKFEDAKEEKLRLQHEDFS